MVRPDVLRRLRRASLAALRREVEAVEQEALGLLLPSAWSRPPRFTPRGARAAPGARVARRAVGERGPAAPRAGLPPSTSTRSPRVARSWSVPAPTGWLSTSASAAVLGQVPPRRGQRTRRTSRSGRRSSGRAPGSICSRRRGLRRRSPSRHCGILVWSGEVTNDAWTPLRAARRFGVAKAERRPRRFSRRRTQEQQPRPDAGRVPNGSSPARSTGAPWPSCCSSGRESSPRRRAAKGFPAATERCTQTFAHSDTRPRRRGTSSRASAGAVALGVPVERLARAARARRGSASLSSSRPPIRPSPTARRCPGRSEPGSRVARRGRRWSLARAR